MSFHGRRSPPSTDSVGLLYLLVLFLFFALFSFFTDRRAISASQGLCNFIASVLYTLLMSCILLTVFQSLRTISKFSPGAQIANLLSKVTNVYIIYGVCIGMIDEANVSSHCIFLYISLFQVFLLSRPSCCIYWYRIFLNATMTCK